jgi:hypothetical protein
MEVVVNRRTTKYVSGFAKANTPISERIPRWLFELFFKTDSPPPPPSSSSSSSSSSSLLSSSSSSSQLSFRE